MDSVSDLLGPPPEPPDDVWSNAVAGALHGGRSEAELAHLVPAADTPPDEGADLAPDPDEEAAEAAASPPVAEEERWEAADAVEASADGCSAGEGWDPGAAE